MLGSQPTRRCTSAPVTFYDHPFSALPLLIEQRVWQLVRQPIWQRVWWLVWQSVWYYVLLSNELSGSSMAGHLLPLQYPTYLLHPLLLALRSKQPPGNKHHFYPSFSLQLLRLRVSWPQRGIFRIGSRPPNTITARRLILSPSGRLNLSFGYLSHGWLGWTAWELLRYLLSASRFMAGRVGGCGSLALPLSRLLVWTERELLRYLVHGYSICG